MKRHPFAGAGREKRAETPRAAARRQRRRVLPPLQPEAHTELSRLAYGLLLMAGLYALLNLFLLPFEFPGLPQLYFGASLFAIFFFLVFSVPFKRRLLLVLLCCAWLALFIVFWPHIYHGARYGAMLVTQQAALVFPWVNPVFLWPENIRSGSALFFNLMVLFPYVGLLAWAVVQRHSFALTAALVLPPFALSFAVHALPPAPTLVVFLAFLAALLIKGQGARVAPVGSAKTSLLSFGLALVFFGGMLAAFPREAYTLSPTVLQVRSGMNNFIRQFSFGGRGILPGFAEGAPLAGQQPVTNLGVTGRLRFSESTALRVQAQQPTAMYLRGFSAGVYTGQAWQQLPEEQFPTAGFGFQPLGYFAWMANVRGFYARSQLVTVENVGGNPNFVYLPYGTNQMPEEGSFTYVQDAYLQAAEDTSRYEIQMTRDFPYNPFFFSLTDFYDTFDEYSYIINGYDVEVTPELDISLIPEGYNYAFHISINGQVSTAYLSPSSHYTASVGSIILSPEHDSLVQRISTDLYDMLYGDRFSRYDSSYYEAIKTLYTGLPAGTGESMRALAAEAGISLPASRMEEVFTTSEVIEYVRQSGSYTATPGVQPRDVDFAYYFLTTSRQGYCVHFATAATVMLRALGIPARYVEGYIVGEAAFGDDGWAEVPAKNAHAWVETWVPGMGWLPWEATPGGVRGGEAAAEGSAPATGGPAATPNTPDEPDIPDQDADYTPTQPQQPSAPSGGGQAAQQTAANHRRWALIALAALLVLAVPLGHMLARRRRSASFRQANTNRAALLLYGYLGRLQRIGGNPASARATQLAQKAKFSNHTLTEEEHGALLSEAAAARAETLARLNLPRRLLFWLLAL